MAGEEARGQAAYEAFRDAVLVAQEVTVIFRAAIAQLHAESERMMILGREIATDIPDDWGWLPTMTAPDGPLLAGVEPFQRGLAGGIEAINHPLPPGTTLRTLLDSLKQPQPASEPRADVGEADPQAGALHREVPGSPVKPLPRACESDEAGPCAN